MGGEEKEGLLGRIDKIYRVAGAPFWGRSKKRWAELRRIENEASIYFERGKLSREEYNYVVVKIAHKRELMEEWRELRRKERRNKSYDLKRTA